ncbi:MAG: terpene cyclase/mutase family protein [Candidatus Bathyarchaeota archaeon]|nr:terpene cyclase/mutase family protein [Candidatus Bathyarchaeota archaeon]
MSWTPLLLTDPSPNLRYLSLKYLLDEPEEAAELEKQRLEDPIVKQLLTSQNPDGSWSQESITGNAPHGKVQVTSQVLTRLGFLEIEHPAVEKAAEYLYSQQQRDGSWPLGNYAEDSDGADIYDRMSLQTSHPLRGLAEAGYASDPRSETAYDWLMEQQLPDGAWPTGVAGDVYGYVAGYRRLPHSRWGCRSNTTAAVTCLSMHPERRKRSETRRGLDHLLGHETRERQYLGFDVARMVGVEPCTGFITYYARFDVTHILKLITQVEASTSDQRVRDLVDFVKEQQGEYGLWEYTKPFASRWVTFDVLRSLKMVLSESDWVNLEPRTPFQPYPSKRKRF